MGKFPHGIFVQIRCIEVESRGLPPHADAVMYLVAHIHLVVAAFTERVGWSGLPALPERLGSICTPRCPILVCAGPLETWCDLVCVILTLASSRLRSLLPCSNMMSAVWASILAQQRSL